jgi:hypothetical protein
VEVDPAKHRFRKGGGMNWKFWKRADAHTAPAGARQARPRQLPDRVGIYLITEKKHDPDWVWSLKAVMLPKTGSKSARSIRIFDPAQAQKLGVAVAGYDFLDAHPHLILFEGWFDKNSGVVRIEKMQPQAA